LRFRDQDIVFATGANGQSKGQNFEIPTANPDAHRGFVLIQKPYSVELLSCSLRRAIS
jgi:hypothetical protein